MKLSPRILIPLVVLGLLALGAVGVASAAQIGSMVMSGASVDEVELIGTVESITPEAWTINGKEVFVTPQTEIKDTLLSVGDMVKVHVMVASDGTLTAREIESLLPGEVEDSSNEDVLNDNDDNLNDNDDMNENDDDLNDNDDDMNDNDDDMNDNDDDMNDNDDDSNSNDDDSNSNDDDGNEDGGGYHGAGNDNSGSDD